MFYKIELLNFPTTNDFKFGTGLYLITFVGPNLIKSAIHYFNPISNIMLILDDTDRVPKEFLDLFKDKKEDASDTNTDDLTIHRVTEDFALKMLAISRANANTIKVSELLQP